MSVDNDRDKLSLALSSLRKRSSSNNHGGFTLIELLIVLAIVAVLLVIASPNYDSIISGSQVDEARLGLATSLALARTEAINRGETITVCAGSNGACSNAATWQTGWQVFTSGNELLQVIERDTDDAAVGYTCGKSLTYTSSGSRGTTGGECVFTISKNGTSKTLSISATGRVRMN
ncbi:MAG: GspH/FimT family pseudopilin [Halopseudomonas sp.]